MVEEEVPDLTRIPLEYHKFKDVFSKRKADTLLEHQPYDLKITLEEGKVPPLGPIYSLSQVELNTLHKCEFHATSVKYLGYILSSEGLTMAESKVKAILDWLEPRKVQDIQLFLRVTNFYHQFIHNYSDIILPLTRLTCKGVLWNFDQCCWDSFNVLKKAFTTAPVLHHWEPNCQITVKTDTSDYAIAGILSIITESRELHPIAFHSQTLSGVELNYNTHDKELLTIFKCFKTWHHYIKGSGTLIDIVTNHKNLEYFSATKLLTHHQAHWSGFLSQFNLVIHLCPGKLSAKLDMLT
ncbi:hypothetical protein BN946_scf184594.g17 [Trametes cinnabarina]|uniref:Reverse transcriptase/retrotransposon-derived protein RNase H-like domain-containing protein n=1 Tax=Pycnoporus cinnabarinus TaxID=5643 RepID=A0A060SRC4_PYCCI|nr:hypothetical protein BN946_scf184594.g17 [Trametes cinnabarina]